MHKGQSVWQFNMRTKELIKRVENKFECEPYCLYVISINKENAAKKIIKLLDAMENKN
jgi:hypothetical protein